MASKKAKHRVTSFPLIADLDYNFSREHLELCRHCGKEKEKHAQGTCLFEATSYYAPPMRDFIDALMRDGGVLTITTTDGKYTLTQPIAASRQDVLLYRGTQAIMRVGGRAKLDEVIDATERP